jgi:hypothetical protein
LQNFGDATVKNIRLVGDSRARAAEQRRDAQTSLSQCCCKARFCCTQTMDDTLLVSLDWEKRGVLEPAMWNYKNIGPNYIRFGCCYFSDRLLFTERRASV